MVNSLFALVAASLVAGAPVTSQEINLRNQPLTQDWVCMMVFNPLTGTFRYECVAVPLPKLPA